MKISVIGLGKLGLPLAASIASKGFSIAGVDIDRSVVDNLNRGKTFLKEPGLQELVTKNRDRLSATDNIKEAVLDSDITFIITPTPSKTNGYFSLKYVKAVVKDIASALKKKKDYHLVVVVSTVMPGSTDELKKILETETGKICGQDFGLCYNPEFIALGSVIYNLLNPDFILIGESDKQAGQILEKFYKTFCDNKPKFARMNFVNAELAKISVNTYITTKISYANMLSEICEKLPGGNVDIVTEAIGFDSRIGNKFFRGGPSFGGPCFPRDNLAFIAFAKKMGSNYSIAESTHKTNIRQNRRMNELIIKLAGRNDNRVGILGLSYKPFTDVIEESFGFNIAKEMLKNNMKVNLYDPVALDNAERIFGVKAGYYRDIRSCIDNSKIIIIATNWPQFTKIKSNWFGNEAKILIDPWRMVDKKSLPENVSYYPLGLNTSE